MAISKYLKIAARISAIALISTVASSCSQSTLTLTGRYQYVGDGMVLSMEFLGDQKVIQEIAFDDAPDNNLSVESGYVITAIEEDFSRIKFDGQFAGGSVLLSEPAFLSFADISPDAVGSTIIAKESDNIILFSEEAAVGIVLTAIN